MKQMCISDDTAKVDSTVAAPEEQQKISPVMDDVLTYLNPPADKKRNGKPTASMAKHLSSQQVVMYMEEKRAAKQQAEEEKQRRKEE